MNDENRRNWDEVGYVDLGPYGDQGLWESLEAESSRQREAARLEEHRKVSSLRDGSFRSATRFHNAPGGPALTALLRSRDLLSLARQATGVPTLVPVRCSYNYYERGDFIGVHRDALRCTLTFTFALMPGLEPMHWAPQLRKADNQAVAELVSAHGATPDGFPELPVAYRELRGFDGYNVPHWRTPAQGPGVLGALCYFEL